jgi:hypothetical protein
MTVDLSDYQEVPERINAFFEQYPSGSLQTVSVEYRDLPAAHKNGEPCLHVIYHAAAYRAPEDERPGHGMASEPLPGLTPYTKGSELMNAETSAWGRALVALGFVAKKVASQEEVRNRQTTSQPPTARVGTGKGFASEKQQQIIKKLCTEKKVTLEQLTIMLDTIGAKVEVVPGWQGKLSGGKDGSASALISWLMERPLPSTEHPTDVPADDEGFVHPEDDGKGTPMELIG